jgi:hypothetical protein
MGYGGGAMKSETLLVEAAIAADYLEERGDFQNLIGFLREVAFVNLLEFCEHNAFRRPIAEPFVQDGYLYATDARIAIRIPTKQSNTEREDGARYPRMADIFTGLKPVQSRWHAEEGWLQWPTKPLEIPTPTDAKQGVVCPICLGGGEYWTDGDTRRCVYCDGDGYLSLYDNASLGPACFSGMYWRLIARLPNVWYREPKNAGKPLWFRFAGGDGVLMPITDPTKAQEISTYSDVDYYDPHEAGEAFRRPE